jgi:hypothetical protein
MERRPEVEVARDEQHPRRRVRYRLDAQSEAVLEAEIAKLTTSGLMVALTRRQMLDVLVARATCCKCGAEERELPVIAHHTAEPTRRRFIDANAFVEAVVRTEARKLADERRTSLNQHQVLRVLVMRAARCRCGTA